MIPGIRPITLIIESLFVKSSITCRKNAALEKLFNCCQKEKFRFDKIEKLLFILSIITITMMIDNADCILISFYYYYFIFIWILVIWILVQEKYGKKRIKFGLNMLYMKKGVCFLNCLSLGFNLGFPFLVVHRKCWLSTRLPFWLLASGPVTCWANQASHRIGPRERQDRRSSREPKSGIKRIGQSQAWNLMTTTTVYATIDLDYKRPK